MNKKARAVSVNKRGLQTKTNSRTFFAGYLGVPEACAPVYGLAGVALYIYMGPCPSVSTKNANDEAVQNVKNA